MRDLSSSVANYAERQRSCLESTKRANGNRVLVRSSWNGGIMISAGDREFSQEVDRGDSRSREPW